MIDYKKDPTYKAKQEAKSISIPPALFIKVDGEGAPSLPAFQEAIQIVYGLIYGIKFWDKQHEPPEDYDKFTVAPLEGIWWTKSGKDFDIKNQKDWQWTVMIRVPQFVTEEFFKKVVKEMAAKKKTDIYEKARLETIHEGLCVQIMHIGAYDKEQPSIEKMLDFAREEGYETYGRHHEIYFGDPRRTPEEKLKTILRYPIKKKAPDLAISKP